MKTKVIIIAGPTASGKTNLAIKLAQELNGELINADSRQLYHGLDVGTNKGLLTATGEFIQNNEVKLQAYELEQSGIKGWLFNFLNPDESFDVNRFREYCLDLIERIVNKDKLPIIVGGTGLYIDALLKNYRLNDVKPDPKLRAELNLLSTPTLFTKLQELDEDKAASLNNSDRNNPHRLIRAIEIALGGNNETWVQQEVTNEYLLIYPKYEKEHLYEKINKRVPQMFDEGMITETVKAISTGYKDTEVLNGIGYKEVQQMLRGEITQEQAITLTAQAHRNYAKRQITWFEGEGRGYELHRFDFKNEIEKIVNEVREFVNN